MLVLPLLVALADPAPAPPQSILVLDLVATDVSDGNARLLTGMLTDKVAARSHMKTLGQEDMRRVVQFNADKAAMGCDTSSCLAEMASAMGVDYIVFGDVGKLGNTYVIQLRLFDAKRNDAVSRASRQGASIDEVRDNVDAAVGELLTPVVGAPAADTPASAPSPAAASSGGPAPLLLFPGIAAAAVGVLGAAGFGLWALALDGTLGDPRAPTKDKSFALGAQPVADVLAVVGAVVAVVGGGLVGASFVVGGNE